MRLRTTRLELRLPAEEELGQFAALAREGIHPPDEMPFRTPWTDGSDSPGFATEFVAHHWGLRETWKPESWLLLLGVWRDGQPIGTQDLRSEQFPLTRTVESGSWVGRSFQGRGYGTEMRTAVLELAFAGLGAQTAISGAFEGNAASFRVSEKLGYVETGEQHVFAPRGVPVRERVLRLDRQTWLARDHPLVEIDGLEPCLSLFGV